MKYFTKIQSFYIFFCAIQSLFAQQNGNTSIEGHVEDEFGKSLENIEIIVEGSNKGTVSNKQGHFVIKNIPSRTCTLIFSGLGIQEKRLTIKPNNNFSFLSIKLQNNVNSMSEVVVLAKTKAEKIEESGFAVEAVEIAKIKTQSVSINAVLDKTSGIRVRTTGGVGSDFEYSINGISGKGIQFFIDGIPMSFYGDSYSINNIPIGLIERVDIYKGVVPVELGADALGGAINLVSNQKAENFLEASTSLGSFYTLQTVVNGLWRLKSGFTTKLSLFSTTSDNNYKVWGDGVFYGDRETGRTIEVTKDNAIERFNDDFKTASAKLDVGFTKKKWADELFLGVLVSDTKQGIQTGQTMGHVYGELRNNEQAFISSLKYKKKNFMTKGLEVDAFAGYSHITDVVIDTTSNSYDWAGQIVGLVNPSGGERVRNGRSLYTQKDKSQMYRLNAKYELPSDFELVLNYIHESTRRSGEDPFFSDSSIPYSEPQGTGAHSVGLSLGTKKLNDKFKANMFVKYFDFNSFINEVVYTTEEEIITKENRVSNWGGGFAASYMVTPKFLLKSSLENATRMPSPTEALGDGINFQPNPDIKPEKSFNVNLGTILGRYPIGKHGLKIDCNAFYRSIYDKLQLLVSGAQSTAIYENLRSIGGYGTEIEIVYDYNYDFKFNINASYLDLRNTQEFDENGNEVITLGDRLRNVPYFMASAGLEYTLKDFIKEKSKITSYLQSIYVHEFFLNWPSLGFADQKNTIPTQLVFDIGVSYTLPSTKMSIAFDVSNILNSAVYDNFLLQKPGRAFSLKATYEFFNK